MPKSRHFKAFTCLDQDTFMSRPWILFPWTFQRHEFNYHIFLTWQWMSENRVYRESLQLIDSTTVKNVPALFVTSTVYVGATVAKPGQPYCRDLTTLGRHGRKEGRKEWGGNLPSIRQFFSRIWLSVPPSFLSSSHSSRWAHVPQETQFRFGTKPNLVWWRSYSSNL